MRRKGLLLVALALVLCSGCQKAADKKDEGSKSAGITSGRQEDGYSPIISETKIDEKLEYPYEIKVNKKQNCITIYGADDTGKYIVPVRAMICSAGGEETPSGTYQLGETSRWQMDADGSFVQYATRIVDDVVFCSAPYASQNNQTLIVEEFNKMGQDVSGSSIQLEVADAKWIAKNCPAGTKVVIFEDKEEGPLGKPKTRTIEDGVRKDPTDSSKDARKGKDYVPVVFEGIEDKTIELSGGCNLLEGISARDSKKQDLTARIQVFGNVDVTTPGTYEVVYMCQNEDKESRAVKCSIQVVDTAETAATQVAQDNVSANASQSVQTGALQDTGMVVFANPAQIPDTTPTPQPAMVPTTAPVSTPTPAPQPVENTQPVAGTTVVRSSYKDVYAPVIQIVADTRYVADVSEATLSSRIRVTDDSGAVAELYITVQPLQQDSYYVIIYEAEDAAGNNTCISETVQVLEPTVFR